MGWHSPGDLPDPGTKHGSPALWADSLPSEPPEKQWQPKQPPGMAHVSWGQSTPVQNHWSEGKRRDTVPGGTADPGDVSRAQGCRGGDVLGQHF